MSVLWHSAAALESDSAGPSRTSSGGSARTRSRIAAAPISWGICDVEGWGHQLPCERVLAEMASCGVTASEAGADGFLPADPAAARKLVADHGLAVAGSYLGLVLHRGISAWRAEQGLEMAVHPLALEQDVMLASPPTTDMPPTRDARASVRFIQAIFDR